MERFWAWGWKYFWGVGVGLIIAWVTSTISYYKAGDLALPWLIIFEVTLSAILLIVAAVMRHSEKRKRR